jgi:hypothetical protein
MDEYVTTMNNQTDIFLNNLHRNFKFVCNNKTIREGKLILFNFNDFHYSFTLDLSGNKKQFKLPMAFTVTEGVSSLKLDYTLNTLCHGIEDFVFNCKMIKPIESKNAFYDNVVEMIFT